jgi:hypothetical protein
VRRQCPVIYRSSGVFIWKANYIVAKLQQKSVACSSTK